MKAAALGAAILSLGFALPVGAQTAVRLNALQIAAACAPMPAAWLPRDPVRVIAAQDSVIRLQFGTRDLVVLDAGANRGLQLNERFYIRRPPSRLRHARWSDVRGANTAGWLRIVAVNADTAVGMVEFACDGLLPGDVLQPYSDPALPPNAGRPDASGNLDFNAAGYILFGDSERTTGAAGDFVVSNLGSAAGAASGSRFAVYRNVGERLPLAAIGEAVAVTVDPNFSVIRITESRDAVASGDLLVPRRP